MLIFWKGKTMVEYRDRDNTSKYDDNDTHLGRHNEDYDCECCHFKKIFMLLVLLILAFMAGIMVGNCGRCRYADYSGYASQYSQAHKNMKPQKMHRGMQPVQNGNAGRAYNTVPGGQVGGFVVEIDQAN